MNDRDSSGDAIADYGYALKTKGPLAYRSPWAWLRYIVPAVLGLTADLWLKSWAFPGGVPADPGMMPFAGRNPGDHTWTVIPGVLGFTTTVNQGAVFGIGQGKVSLFLGFSFLALVIILWVFASSGARHRVVHIALGLITAGALGNLFDRALYHGVRDMLRFTCFVIGDRDYYPYIFNIADVCLCVGVPLLILRWLFVKDGDGTLEKTATA
jgi:signal peptidase II